jgi:serine/threonine protein kinase
LDRELVLTQGHDKSVDYWAYGVLMYELLCGQTPFESSNQQRTFEKIVHAQKHLSFPSDFDPHGKSLIRRLLHPNAVLRLGALQNGISDIINHAFFSMRNLDFEALLAQELDSIYKPNTDDISASINTSTVADIEPLDMEIELDTETANDLDSHFADLNNPELLE